MANKMFVDATHPEETRVAVVRGNRLEEFDFESASRKPLRGNIYLAKVTRVEPSLQAAFIEYGGNRHGFLAFSEIHPDYYQIPVADRQALLEEDARAEREEEDEAERPRGGKRRRGRNRTRSQRNGDSVSTEIKADEDGEPTSDENAEPGDEAADGEIRDASVAEPTEASGYADDDSGEATSGDAGGSHDDDDDEADEGDDEEQTVEQVGSGDALDEMPERRRPTRRQYKIQEVIKRRQIMLVQVVKEERGNKGAALTTYLSLAGRYSVLMPNSGRGGGISRKITSAEDRRRLKDVVQDLDVPEGMGIILRTAGASRTKPEIRRDYEYLMRMWDSVRELTLTSSAPTLVYEEGSLIKRSIRDLYGREVDEVVVAGEQAYREAKDFMRMLMPTHVRAVKPWRETQPVFARSGVESQLDGLFSNTVTLRSGGYIVINQTEALVAIDINSGRSTREHNIEDTALKTNLEAADEIARQLRLRDLAGLIVIDFIDMEEKRNNRSVEKRLKDALKNDRARIQVGRISPFGLLEMSRQRMRTGMMESSSIPCPHCSGTGMIRSHQSVALQVLRAVEEALARNPNHNITVRTRPNVAMYLLNQKRASLREIEGRFGIGVMIEIDAHQMGQTYHVIERGELVPDDIRTANMRLSATITAEAIEDEDEDEIIEDIADDREDEAEARPVRGDNDDEDEDELDSESREARGEDGQRRKRRRRRRRRGGRDGEANGAGLTTERTDDEAASDDAGDGEDEGAEADGERIAGGEERGEGGKRRRRRGRRGGRRFREENGERVAGDDTGETLGDDASEQATPAIAAEAAASVEVEVEAEPVADAPKARARRSRKKVETTETEAETEVAVEIVTDEAPVKARRSRAGAKAKTADADTAPAAPVIEAAPEVKTAPEPAPTAEEAPPAPPPEPVHMVLSDVDPDRPRRGGWWSRKG